MHLPRLIPLALVAGCVIETTHATTTVTAHWTLEDLATGETTACPAGFDIARLVATPSDGGDAITTDFPCAAGTGVSAPLSAMPYELAIEIRADDGTVYARSLASTLDFTSGVDLFFNATILNDAGYAHVTWTLAGATSGSALSCAGGTIDTIVVTSTSGAMSYVDQLPCEDQGGLTRALAPGAYTFAIAASRGGVVQGTAAATGQIAARNQVAELGAVQLALAGL